MALTNVAVDAEMLAGVDTIAAQRSLSREAIIHEALGNYLEEKRQIAAIEEGIREADAGNFATEEEVRAAFARWGVNAQ